MTSYNYCRLISEALIRNESKMSGMQRIAENRGPEKIDMTGGRLGSLDIREKTIGLEPIVEVEKRMGGSLGPIGRFLLKKCFRPPYQSA